MTVLAPAEEIIAEFTHDLKDCEHLFRAAAAETAHSQPNLSARDRREFVQRMADLHAGVLLKLFLEISDANSSPHPVELVLAGELFAHAWGQRLKPPQAALALEKARLDGTPDWNTLLGPFQRYEPFRRRRDEMFTILWRLANIVAKADEQITPAETRALQALELHLLNLLKPIPLAESASPLGPIAQQQQLREPPPRSKEKGEKLLAEATRPTPALPTKTAEPVEKLEDLLGELDSLIGLTNIKEEVKRLTQFLQFQRARLAQGLPASVISLHSIFTGNPGTGKTTVARLMGRIFKALGLLQKGHLVETDRSGLVAEYAGQTASKAHKQIDEAIDGILFIDEAYSLVAERGEDPYGLEAVQVLLKRMEDQRDRLIVILAGYPEPMLRLLQSNPGLSSRFQRSLEFPDYSAAELACIFQQISQRGRYVLPPETRLKILAGFTLLTMSKDEHFGNGRLARNVFERSVMEMARRVAREKNVTVQLLTEMRPDDIVFEGIAEQVWQSLRSVELRVRITCSHCRQTADARPHLLGRRVQCRRCLAEFTPEWGDLNPAVLAHHLASSAVDSAE